MVIRKSIGYNAHLNLQIFLGFLFYLVSFSSTLKMMTLSEFWSQCLLYMQENIPHHQLAMWVSVLTVDEDENGVWTVFAPNEFAMRFVQTYYLKTIHDFQHQVAPNTSLILLKKGKGSIKSEIQLTNRQTENASAIPSSNDSQKSADETLDATTEESSAKKSSTSKRTMQKTRPSKLNPAYTFDNLVMGNANQLAFSAGLNVCMDLGKSDHNPLCIYGGTGLGKTHLSQAIAHRVAEEYEGINIHYTHAEGYMKDYLQAVRHHDFDAFKKHYQSMDLLIVDDVQFLSGKDKTMEEFFYLFNHLIENHKQIILTSDQRPDNIEGLTERLQTRFSGGLVVQIEPPALEMRIEILQRKASNLKIDLSDDCAYFIAENISASVRDLEGAIKSIKAHTNYSKGTVDIYTIKNILKDIILSNTLITPEMIQQTVAHYYQLRVNDLLSQKRTRSLARPRQMAMSLAKNLTTLSLADIGASFNGRDHSTVLHACKTVDKLKSEDAHFAKEYDSLYEMIKKH